MWKLTVLMVAGCFTPGAAFARSCSAPARFCRRPVLWNGISDRGVGPRTEGVAPTTAVTFCFAFFVFIAQMGGFGGSSSNVIRLQRLQ